MIAAVGRLRQSGIPQPPSDGDDSRVCDICYAVVPIEQIFGGHCAECEGLLVEEYGRLNDEAMAESGDIEDSEEPNEELELAGRRGEGSEVTDWDDDGAELTGDDEPDEPKDD